METVRADDLVLDRFHVRERLDAGVVAAYGDNLESLPPVLVWRDDDETGDIVLLDGRHRVQAHLEQERESVPVNYFEGSREEAEAKAWSANLKHGLPLTRAEKRAARTQVVKLLYRQSNNWIAKELGCSSNTVAAIREDLEAAGEIPELERFERKGGGTIPRTYDGGEDEAEDEIEEGGGGDKEEYRGKKGGGSEQASFHSESDVAGGQVSSASSKSGGKEALLRFAALGEPMAVEATIFIDGDPHNIPATLFIVDGEIAGVSEAAPGFDNVLMLRQEAAEGMNLIWW